jgi:hypothetical protein
VKVALTLTRDQAPLLKRAIAREIFTLLTRPASPIDDYECTAS